ncbi:histidinol-phosphate transaminase [Tissierella creatinini]|nr:histidinol-phosphate transaminase [Tissierella creatinini]TJX66746.1 histidinol-phosphate transaminase [Soehngenia saccharolytica]
MLKYLREDIKTLKSYEVNQEEFRVKLDANEGIEWMDGKNRYPDDSCTILKERLANKLGKKTSELLIGNGSSELIELVMKAYLEYGEIVVSISPTFSMYKLYTIINKGVYEEYPLKDMQKLDVEGFMEFVKLKKPKIIILSNPNNPTGSIISRENILRIVEDCDCMVILDEAYIEFADVEIQDYTREYKNLVVLRTFSKAYALAGIRLGYMIGNEEIIEYINRVRSPYNINTITQNLGLEALDNEVEIMKNISLIKIERERVFKKLKDLGFKPFPSQANFIFFKGKETLSYDLARKKILIRAFSGELKGYYRISIGRPEENDLALKAIEEALNETGHN